jgi:hypothetical protein
MNPMQSMKLIVWERMVDGGRRWFSAGCAAGWAIVAVSLASGFLVAAQEPDEPAQPNDAMAAEVLSQLSELLQPPDSAQLEDMTPPEDLTPDNGLPPANGLPQANRGAPGGDRPNRFVRPDSSSRSESSSRPQGPSRSKKDDRRSRGKRPSSSGSGQFGGFGSASEYSRGSDRSLTNSLAGTNKGSVTPEYSAFGIIVERNIFDPNRFPRRPGQERPPSRSYDYVTLVGTMTYEQGTFAFFDGTSSAYRKALKLADAIAGYKVTNIAPDGVKLSSGTNQLELRVGAQLRREEDGPWRLASQSRSYGAPPSLTSTNAAASTSSTAASSVPESDILKRLMQKREQE